MTRHRGMCEGGPYDGQWIYHGKPVMPVAMRGPKVVTYFGPPTDEIKIFEYSWDNGTWHWKGPD